MSLSNFLESRLGSPSTPISQAILDSLEVMELVLEIEERYKITVDECDLFKDQTVGDFSIKLEQRLKERNEGKNVL